MPEFSTVYFDTNVLVANGWPRLSAALSNLLELTKVLEVEVLIPDPVERELEAHWIREFKSRSQSIDSAVKKLTKHVDDVVRAPLGVSMPSIDAAMRDYRAKAEGLRNENRIQIAPMTRRSLEEVFLMATTRRAPIGDEGRGFQDMVVVLSVVDHLRETGSAGAFITQDSRIEEGHISAIASEAGVTLAFFPSIDQLYRVLVQRLAANIRNLWDQEKHEVAESLRRILPAIGDFIARSVEITAGDLGVFGRLIAVPSMKVIDVKNVSTPLPIGREPHQPFQVSFDTEVSFTIVLERYTFPRPPVVRVGQDVEESLALLSALQQPQRVEEGQIREVTVEATIASTPGGYEIVEFLSALIKREVPPPPPPP